MAAGNRDDSEKVTTQFVWKIPWIIKKSKENRVTGAWNTSFLTIQSGPATAPDYPSGDPFSGITCKNAYNLAHFTGKRQFCRIYGKRSDFF